MEPFALKILKAVLLMTAIVSVGGCSAAYQLGESLPGAVLSAGQGESMLHQCSRWAPTEVTEFWVPDSELIERLEIDLPRLARIKAKRCCLLEASVRSPSSYYRQYVGVIWKGRKLIYVNAFSAPEPGWESEAVAICDGGAASWGALYDPAQRRFEELAVNGIS